MSALGAQVLDVRSQSLGDAEAVEPEEKNEGERPRAVLLGRTDEGGQLVSVEARGHGVGPDPGTLHVGHGVTGDHVFADGVLVEAGECAEAPGNGGRGAAIDLGQGPGVGVDVGSLRRQGVDVVAGAPGEPGPQVTTVGGSGGPLVGKEEGGGEGRGRGLERLNVRAVDRGSSSTTTGTLRCSSKVLIALLGRA